MKLGVRLKMDEWKKVGSNVRRCVAVDRNKIALGVALTLCSSLSLAEVTESGEKGSSQNIAKESVEKEGVGQTPKEKTGLQDPQRRAQVVNTMQGFYFSLGEFSLDSKAAREEGVKDSATYFQFAWQMQDDELLFGAGLSGLLYKDLREFTQLVEDTSGDEYTADSEAQAVNLFGEVGYAYSPNEYISLNALAGLEIVLSSERSIAGCSNCDSQDIDLSSGLYISPRVRILPNKYFMMGLAYQQYLTGDINGGLMFTIGGRF